MYIYTPEHILPERIIQARKILKKIPTKYAFISGSFLYKKKYHDIDIFAVTRKNIPGVQRIDFNDLHGIFYHSISKCCIAKSPLPKKPLKLTLSKFWESINEAVPELMNRNKKQSRTFFLQKTYLEKGIILDSFELSQMYISKIPLEEIRASRTLFQTKMKKSYLLRYFHTQAGFYRKPFEYSSQKFLYTLTQQIIHGN